MNRYKILEFVMLVLLLQSCAGMPIGNNELLPMTQQQVVTGVVNVFTGNQSIYFSFQHTSGLRILLWPGANDGNTVLWNMVCIEQCGPGWQRVGAGLAMSYQRASSFAQYLKSADWKEITPALAGIPVWIQENSNILSGFFVVFPVIPSLIPEQDQT